MTDKEKAGAIMAIRHWYGGPCGETNCVWCEEMAKVKEEFARQDAEDDKLIGEIMQLVKAED